MSRSDIAVDIKRLFMLIVAIMNRAFAEETKCWFTGTSLRRPFPVTSLAQNSNRTGLVPLL